MEPRTTEVLFALLRSGLWGKPLTQRERAMYSPELLTRLAEIAEAHDVAHLLALGLKVNALESGRSLEGEIFRAVYRCEAQSYALAAIAAELERAEIAYIPLKGAILRSRYPELWMRTSCDIDILVNEHELERAIACLMEKLHYSVGGRGTHDISLVDQRGSHVELHFDLMEEGAVNSALGVLRAVWDHVSPCEAYRHEMTDAFFYFYHVAHMAKHFRNGGCGIRSFIDLWLLEHGEDFDAAARGELLEKGGLSAFAERSRQLSEVWLGGTEHTEVTLRMQEYILRGGSYGAIEQRVAVKKQRGGRGAYLLSRAFAPYERLVRYYPILEKRRYLLPLMQVRRWFMLMDPSVAKMAKGELAANRSVSHEEIRAIQCLMQDVGL